MYWTFVGLLSAVYRLGLCASIELMITCCLLCIRGTDDDNHSMVLSRGSQYVTHDNISPMSALAPGTFYAQDGDVISSYNSKNHIWSSTRICPSCSIHNHTASFKSDDGDGRVAPVRSKMQARQVMYALLFGFGYTNSCVWQGSVGPVMSFILAEYSAWPASQVGLLLGAFALGYVPLQIPYSLLARRTGQKILCTVNLAWQAIGCALIPRAAAAGPMALSAVYILNGIFQGSRVPCVQVMQQRWIPDGMERVRHQQVTSWASQGGAVLHSFLVPLLSQHIGWRVVTRWYAVQSALMAVLWHKSSTSNSTRASFAALGLDADTSCTVREVWGTPNGTEPLPAGKIRGSGGVDLAVETYSNRGSDTSARVMFITAASAATSLHSDGLPKGGGRR